jgi:hypothetical protein
VALVALRASLHRAYKGGKEGEGETTEKTWEIGFGAWTL